MDNQHGPAPRYTGDWHRFKDWPPLEKIYPGRPILVYWEDKDQNCFLYGDFTYENGRLYDSDLNEVNNPDFLETAIWSYWPDKL